VELDLIVPWVVQNFQLGDVRRCRALAEMAWGLMKAGVVTFAAIGRCMPGAATAASCITRVFRFCHNKGIDPLAVQAALVNLLVGRTVGSVGGLTQIATVSVDWHSYDNGDISGLRVSLVTGSRALPLLWYEIKTKDLKGQQTELEQRAIRDLISYRPPGITWLVLLDAGFGHSAELITLLEQAGYYAVRQSVRMLVHSNSDCWTSIGDLPVRLGQVVDFGWLHWTVADPRKVRIVGARLYEGKRPKRGRRSSVRHYKYSQPGLCVVATNLPGEQFSAISVIRIYARRFEIEHNFRDLKNASLGMDMEHVHLEATSTYSRLMCIVAVAEALLWLNGAEAESQGLQHTLTPSRPKTGRRILSLRNLGHLCLGKLPIPIDRLLRKHLRVAIAAAPGVVGRTWKDVRDRRELKDLAPSSNDLRPLRRSCRRVHKGEGCERCQPAVEWNLTGNLQARAERPTERKAA
jgi:hypothetical protein